MAQTLIIKWGADGLLWGDKRAILGPTPNETPPAKPVEEQPILYAHQLLTVETDPVLRMTTFWEKEIIVNGDTYIGGLAGVNFDTNNVGIGPDGRHLPTTISFNIGDATDDPARVGQQGYDILRRFLTQRLGGIFAQIQFVISADRLAWELLPNTVLGRLSNSRLQDNVFRVDIVSETLQAYNKEELLWSHDVQLILTDGQDRGFFQAKAIADGHIKTRFPNWRDA